MLERSRLNRSPKRFVSSETLTLTLSLHRSMVSMTNLRFDWRKSLNLGDRCDLRGIDLISIGEVGDLGGADLTGGRERVSEWLKKTRNDAVARGSRPSDRASDGVQAVAGGGGENALRSGEGDSRRGMERTAGEVSGDGLRWYPWPVLRSHRALSDRRKCSRYQLSLYGRLCRSVWHSF